MKINASRFVKGTFLLTASGFAVRLLGFIYKVYLSNTIGAEGMGLLQLIAPVFTVVVTAISAGVSNAVSGMVAADIAGNCGRNCSRIALCSSVLSAFMGIAASVALFFGAECISKYIFCDERTMLSFMVMIPSIPFICVSAALKGYFFGRQNMTPASVAQIIEQVIRISIIVAFIARFAQTRLDVACALASGGLVAGEVFNLLTVSVFYAFSAKKKKKRRKDFDANKSRRKLTSEIVKNSAPVSAGKLLTSVLTAIETVIIPIALVRGGLDKSAGLAALGRISGMALPLMMFPGIITAAMSTSLIPAISGAEAVGRLKERDMKIEKSIRFSIIMGFAVFGVFYGFAPQIASITYPNAGIAEILRKMSCICIFLYPMQTLAGIMNGLAMQKRSLINSAIGYTLRIAITWLCVPGCGVDGYIAAVVTGDGIVCLLDMIFVLSRSSMMLSLFKWSMWPALSAAAAVAASKLCTPVLNVDGKFHIITVILLGAVFGMTLLIASWNTAGLFFGDILKNIRGATVNFGKGYGKSEKENRHKKVDIT